MVLFQRKKKYSRISYEKRLMLIKMVQNQNVAITKASKKLHIKLPTAKVILRNYRKEGKILAKKTQPTLNPIKIQNKDSISSLEQFPAPQSSSCGEEAEKVELQGSIPSYFYYHPMIWYIL